jgi:hypothetical protein
MMYVKCAHSLRNVEELLADRRIDVSYETIRVRLFALDGYGTRWSPLQKKSPRVQRPS